MFFIQNFILFIFFIKKIYIFSLDNLLCMLIYLTIIYTKKNHQMIIDKKPKKKKTKKKRNNL